MKRSSIVHAARTAVRAAGRRVRTLRTTLRRAGDDVVPPVRVVY